MGRGARGVRCFGLVGSERARALGWSDQRPQAGGLGRLRESAGLPLTRRRHGAQGRAVDPVGGDRRRRRPLGDAAFIALELADEQLDATGTEGTRLQVEAGARAGFHVGVQGDESVGLG